MLQGINATFPGNLLATTSSIILDQLYNHFFLLWGILIPSFIHLAAAGESFTPLVYLKLPAH